MVIFYSSYNERIILLVVLLYVVPTECTDHTEAYGLKLFESTEWPTLREARIHRNDCLLDWITSAKIRAKKRATVMIRGQYDIRHFKIIIHKKMLLVTKMVSIQKKITIFALK